jgi:hypothetical protein
MKLCAFGGIWVFFGFCVVALAYLMWGLIAMSVAIYGACLLLIFSMGVVIPAERDATIFFAAVIIFISLVCILGPPQIPTLIVQALGIGAYDDADVVVEKRYCESLVAEGMPLFRNPASWDEDRSRHQRDVESLSYIQVLNDDTIMLRHMRVLLRVGGQVALRRRGASEKQGFVNRSIILVPATQILQVSALYVRSPP